VNALHAWLFSIASGEPIQTVDSAGNVRAMSRAEYLSEDVPPLQLAVVGDSMARRASLRVRGLPTGLEIERVRN
jgi:hypothetical protein